VAEGLDFGFEGGEAGTIAAGEDEIGASPGKCAGKCLPESAAGTGYNRDSTAQIEEPTIRWGVHD
jgi:hypothetical protein